MNTTNTPDNNLPPLPADMVATAAPLPPLPEDMLPTDGKIRPSHRPASVEGKRGGMGIIVLICLLGLALLGGGGGIYYFGVLVPKEKAVAAEIVAKERGEADAKEKALAETIAAQEKARADAIKLENESLLAEKAELERQKQEMLATKARETEERALAAERKLEETRRSATAQTSPTQDPAAPVTARYNSVEDVIRDYFNARTQSDTDKLVSFFEDGCKHKYAGKNGAKLADIQKGMDEWVVRFSNRQFRNITWGERYLPGNSTRVEINFDYEYFDRDSNKILRGSVLEVWVVDSLSYKIQEWGEAVRAKNTPAANVPIQPRPAGNRANDAALNKCIIDLSNLNARSESAKLFRMRLLTLLPLIRNGAHVDVTTLETKGNTALHYACGIGSMQTVRWLIVNGANVNAVTDKGATPLKCIGDDPSGFIRNMLINSGARK